LRENYFKMVVYNPDMFGLDQQGPGGKGLAGSPGLGMNLFFLFLSGCLYIYILYRIEHKALVKVPKKSVDNNGTVVQSQGEVPTFAQTTEAYQYQYQGKVICKNS